MVPKAIGLKRIRERRGWTRESREPSRSSSKGTLGSEAQEVEPTKELRGTNLRGRTASCCRNQELKVFQGKRVCHQV